MTEPRRVLVCGGRDFDDIALLQSVLETWLKPGDIVVHGNARGADRMAATYWKARGGKTDSYSALWDVHGKAAGVIRNQAMLDSGIDLCIAFPGGRGTADMVRRCVGAGVITYSNFITS